MRCATAELHDTTSSRDLSELAPFAAHACRRMRLNSSCESLKLRSSLYIKPLSRQRDCVRPMLARSCRQKAAASHRSRKWLFIRASSVGATLTQPSLQEEPVDSSRSWVPSGDQPSAIRNIVTALKRGDSNTLLRGATGTGGTRSWSFSDDACVCSMPFNQLISLGILHRRQNFRHEQRHQGA